MSDQKSTQKDLVQLWGNRLNDARLRLDFTRNFMREIEKDVQAGAIPSSNGELAFREALRAEREALAQFGRVLRIYIDLVVHGKMPGCEQDCRPNEI